MTKTSYDRELAFRNVLTKGLRCSPDCLQNRYSNYSIGRWGDPAGVADASFFTCHDNMSQLEIVERKFVVGYFLMAVKNIMEQCGLNYGQMDPYLKKVSEATSCEEVFEVMDAVIDILFPKEGKPLLEDCCTQD